MSGFVTGLIDPFLDWIWPLKVCLPQQADFMSRLCRKWRLFEQRRDYQYNYSHVSTLAIADTVPIKDLIQLDWFLAVSEKVLVALANRASLEISPASALAHQNTIQKFRSLKMRGVGAVPEIRDLIQQALRFDQRISAKGSPVASLQEYSSLFRSIGLPPIAADFQLDSVFADMRVAGPNPVMLQRMTVPDERLPISEAQFQGVAPGDSMAAAMAEARLYLADYAILDGAETGTYPHGQKYLAAPIALFVVDKRTRQLNPVAIQCQQKPGPLNPIILPSDGWNWLIAKTFVEIADGNVHEAITHLGRTHLSMEPFVLASLRRLAGSHPLSRLLRPHFEGTLSINQLAWQFLIADHGAVDMLMSTSIQAARGLAASGVQTMDIMKSRLPNTFAARGVDDASALPHYPYRDDSTLYWNAIRNWAHAYARLYYASDAVIAQDWELQAWVRELAAHDGGRINGLPGNGMLQTVDELVEVLTFVIFTCSVQHAAVNYPQYDYMAYAPNMPLASYRAPFTSSSGAGEQDFLAMLPMLDMAQLQMELGYMLGTVHFTNLGQYPDGQFAFDGRVTEAQQKFQDDLSAIGQKITASNQLRVRPYTMLEPAGIPQSINI